MNDTLALRIVHSAAPIRICDNGGWTDTWFARHGRVFHVAVEPCVEVEVAVYPRTAREDRAVIFAENYGERYAIAPGMPRPDRHPLLECAVEEVGLPEEMAVEISIHSEVPAGCSTGTSAAVTVALIGALAELAGARMTPHEIARTAHRVEVEHLGLQSGVQDQLCSAYGGINHVEISRYPEATVSPLHVPDATWWELDRRLSLIFLGRGHLSSPVHERVIAELSRAGDGPDRLEPLRRAADAARDAVGAGDLDALGRSMIANTEAQANLHAELVGPDALQIIEIARTHGAAGWKVNGAGGDGGSVTLLGGPSAPEKRAMLRAIRAANPLFQPIPIRLSRSGLRVWG